MKLDELLGLDHLMLDLRAGDKARLLQEMAQHAGALLHRPFQPIYDALQRREALGSTGLGGGFAIPHAQLDGLDDFFALFARLNRPLSFDAIDEKPVDMVLLLLTPRMLREKHVSVLASVCRTFRDPSFARRLRLAKSVKDVQGVMAQPG